MCYFDQLRHGIIFKELVDFCQFNVHLSHPRDTCKSEEKNWGWGSLDRGPYHIVHTALCLDRGPDHIVQTVLCLDRGPDHIVHTVLCLDRGPDHIVHTVLCLPWA